MSGKPYQSGLIPFEQEIFELRRRRPPMTYAQIADLMRERHNVSFRREAIFKFIKVRSRGRRAYFVLRQAARKESASGVREAKPVSTVVDPQVRAEQMGHTVDVNETVYTFTSLKRRKDAVNALEKAIGA